MFHQNGQDTSIPSFPSFLLLGTLAFLSACPTVPKTTDDGYLTRQDFEKGDWTIPRGDIENCQRELTLLVYVDEDGAKQTNLCKYVEAELGRIKRFKTYVAWNNGGIKLATDLADIGEAASIVQVKPSFNLILNLSILGRRQETDTPGGNRLYSFNTDVACTLSDVGTGDQVFARVFGGVKNYRETVMGLSGRVGGFNPDNGRDVDTAFAESVTTALRDIVSQLGNEYPVVARITNATSSRLSIDKGTDMGLFGAENFIVLEDLGGGLYIPIMKAGTETVLKNNGTLKILASNTSDGDAMPIIAEFRENPRGYVEKRARAILAVTKGLGVPANWDATYKKVMATDRKR